jgi:hypothetical protein
VRADSRNDRNYLDTDKSSRADRERAPVGGGNLGEIPASPHTRYVAPAVVAADWIDYWIRHAIEYWVPDDAPGFAARGRPAGMNPPPQSAWLSAIGHCLRIQYDDALTAPIPPHLDALVTQLQTAIGQSRQALVGSAEERAPLGTGPSQFSLI